MKKQIPNIITLTRIAASIALFFITIASAPFYVVYIYCGLSDALDGFLARRLDAVSKSGAVLDSISDFFFFAAVIYILLNLFPVSVPFAVLIVIIAVIKILSAVIGPIRFKTPIFLHTVSNKTAGALIYLCPLVCGLIGTRLCAIIVCSAALLAAVEELAIILLARSAPHPDIKSITLLNK